MAPVRLRWPRKCRADAGVSGLINFLLILAIALPLLVIGGLIAIVRILAASNVQDDVASSLGPPRAPSLVGRFRAWLTSTPKKLDYRRDKRGRFRRMRRW